jgi:hypothetical protein
MVIGLQVFDVIIKGFIFVAVIVVAGSVVEGEHSFYWYWFLDLLDLDRQSNL